MLLAAPTAKRRLTQSRRAQRHQARLLSWRRARIPARFGGLIALQNLLNESATPPAIVSISYGECEAKNGAASNAAFSSTYQQAVTEGVSMFVSAGDEGAASCDADQSIAVHGIGVSGFASTIYNVAVGGTDFGDTAAGTNSTYWNSTNGATFGSAISYIPEIPWNDSCASVLISTLRGLHNNIRNHRFLQQHDRKDDFLTTGIRQRWTERLCDGNRRPQPGWSAALAPGMLSLHGNRWWACRHDSVRDIPDVSLFAANGVWGHYYVFCFPDTASGRSGPARERRAAGRRRGRHVVRLADLGRDSRL